VRYYHKCTSDFKHSVQYFCLILTKPEFDEICGLLGYYAALCGKCFPTFWDNVSVPSSWVKSPSGKKAYNVDSGKYGRVAKRVM
jgi:hypothetical protein